MSSQRKPPPHSSIDDPKHPRFCILRERGNITRLESTQIISLSPPRQPIYIVYQPLGRMRASIYQRDCHIWRIRGAHLNLLLLGGIYGSSPSVNVNNQLEGKTTIRSQSGAMHRSSGYCWRTHLMIIGFGWSFASQASLSIQAVSGPFQNCPCLYDNIDLINHQM